MKLLVLCHFKEKDLLILLVMFKEIIINKFKKCCNFQDILFMILMKYFIKLIFKIIIFFKIINI